MDEQLSDEKLREIEALGSDNSANTIAGRRALANHVLEVARKECLKESAKYSTNSGQQASATRCAAAIDRLKR